MLLKCPECTLPISDKAHSCPHCGFPIDDKPKHKRQMAKRKRLPNGFGQITELKNQNLRNPYRAMVCVGKRSDGRPISKLLKPVSYFKTYNDAYEALVEYNKNPYDLDDYITVKELYERWSSAYVKKYKAESSARTISSAWSYCSAVYDIPVKELRARHIRGCIDDGYIIVNGEVRHTTPNIKGRIKSMFNLMLDYALEYEIVDKNFSRTFHLADDVVEEREEMKRAHIPFTDAERAMLWKNVNTPYVKEILIQRYTGMRPRELCDLKTENVHIDERYIVGGMKTKAGTNRMIPIHDKILSFVKEFYESAINEKREYLFAVSDSATHKSSSRLTYDKYQSRFKHVVEVLGMNSDHRAHDPRVDFVTSAKKCGIDENIIKRIVGHEISDVTESAYTVRDMEWILKELNKLD